MWIHVDAAWAGVTLACPEHREAARLNDINKHGDSLCVNFHKWGLVNFDASGFWVKNRKLLTDTLDITPEFLRSKQGDAGTVIDYRNWHLALGRRFRSLKLWFVLRSFGQEGFREYIRHGIDLNDYFGSLIRQNPSFSLVTRPSFSLTVFRLTPPQSQDSAQYATLEDFDALNRSFYSRISARPDILLTQTVIDGIFCIRFAAGAQRTTKEHIDQAWSLIQEEAGIAADIWLGGQVRTD